MQPLLRARLCGKCRQVRAPMGRVSGRGCAAARTQTQAYDRPSGSYRRLLRRRSIWSLRTRRRQRSAVAWMQCAVGAASAAASRRWRSLWWDARALPRVRRPLLLTRARSPYTSPSSGHHADPHADRLRPLADAPTRASTAYRIDGARTTSSSTVSGACATRPSVTRASRTSPLCGLAVSGSPTGLSSPTTRRSDTAKSAAPPRSPTSCTTRGGRASEESMAWDWPVGMVDKPVQVSVARSPSQSLPY